MSCEGALEKSLSDKLALEGFCLTVSIVVPFENDFRPLKETLLSVTRQSYQDWEIVAVDMGASDGSQQLIRALACGDRITLLSAADASTKFAAINAGVACSSGDWILVLEAGDRFESRESLGKIVTEADDKNEIVILSYSLSNKNSKENVSVEKLFSDEEYFLNQDIPLCSIFWRRAVLNKLFPKSYILNGHKKILAKYLSSQQKVGSIDEANIVRDAGNAGFIYHYAPVKIKESYRALYGKFSSIKRLLQRRGSA